MLVSSGGKINFKLPLFFRLARFYILNEVLLINKYGKQMKKIKRLLASLLFSNEQRDFIWNSLEFSRYTYKRRGQGEEAEEVLRVMNSLEYVIKNELPRVYTQAELDEAVEDALRGARAAAEDILQYEKDRAYNKGLRLARAEAEVIITELEGRLTADNQVTFPKPHQVDNIKVRENLINEIESNE